MNAAGTVKVQFSVRTGRDRFVVEPTTAVVDETSTPYPYGRVQVELDDVLVFVEDELMYTVAALCYEAPAQVATGGSYMALTNSYQGEYHVENLGAEVRLHGESVFDAEGRPDASLVAPAAEILPALHACGRRAQHFYAAHLGSDSAGELEALDGLQEESAEALAKYLGAPST